MITRGGSHEYKGEVTWPQGWSHDHKWGSHDHRRESHDHKRGHMTTGEGHMTTGEVTWPQERAHDYKKGSQRAINELQVLTTCRAGESGGMLPRKHWNWNSQFEEIANLIPTCNKSSQCLGKNMHALLTKLSSAYAASPARPVLTRGGRT